MSHCRLEAGLPRHPKILRLMHRLSVKRREAMGLVAELWCWVQEVRPGGLLDGISEREIELALAWDGAPGECTQAMIECGWLDLDPDSDSLEVHGWSERADSYKRAKDDKKRRVAKRRTHSARTTHAPCTPPERKERRERNDSTTPTELFPATCADAPSPAPPATKPAPVVLAELACSRGASWPLTEDAARKLSTAFPAVDVLAEARQAIAWLEMHPSKRPTTNGAGRFFHSWCRKAQNDASVRSQPRPVGFMTAKERMIHAGADLAREAERREQREHETTYKTLEARPKTSGRVVRDIEPRTPSSAPQAPWSIRPGDGEVAP